VLSQLSSHESSSDSFAGVHEVKDEERSSPRSLSAHQHNFAS